MPKRKLNKKNNKINNKNNNLNQNSQDLDSEKFETFKEIVPNIPKNDKNRKEKLKILEEANLIIRSVNFTNNQINEKIDKLDFARENFLIKEEGELEEEIKILIKKLGKENKEMDKFLAKYQEQLKLARMGLY